MNLSRKWVTHELAVGLTVAFLVAVGWVGVGVVGGFWPGQGTGPTIALDGLAPDAWLQSRGVESRPAASEAAAGLLRLLWFTTGALSLAWVTALASLVIVQLGRATSLMRDYAVRSALGVSGVRLVVHVVRNTVGAVCGGALLGVGVGSLGLIVGRSAWPHRLLGDLGALPDRTSVLVVIVVPLFVGVIAAVVPAIAVWRRRDLSSRLGAAGSSPVRGDGVARLGLAILQVAATIALLMATGALRGGIVSDEVRLAPDVASIAVQLPQGMTVAEALGALEGEGLDEQGVTLASRAALVHLGDRTEVVTECGVCIKGLIMTRLSATNVRAVSVGPTFFDTAAVGVVSGRAFGPADGDGAAAVAVVNQTFARGHFQDGNPLGRKVVLGAGFGPALTVIGVVEDRPARTIGLRLAVRPTLYLSALQYEPLSAEVVVRGSDGTRSSLAAAVRSAGLLPMGPAEDLAERIGRRMAPLQWLLGLVALVSVVGLLVSGFGVFAVLGNLTRVRRRDMALRLAVGATPLGVSWMTLRWAGSVILAGLLLGTLLGSGTVTRIRMLVPSAPLFETGMFLLSWGVLMLAGLIGALVPVLNSLRIAPAEVLRDDRV